MSVRVGLKFSQQLCYPVFSAVFRRNLENRQKHSRIIQNVELIREFASSGHIIRLFDIPWTPVFLLVIFLLHPLIGFIATAFAGTMLIVDWLGDRKQHDPEQTQQPATKKADRFLDRSMRQTEEIWSMGMFDGVSEYWYRQRTQAFVEESKDNGAKSKRQALRRFIQQCAQMAMLGVGAFLAVTEQITAGSIIAGSIICSRALAPIGGLTRSWRSFYDVRRAISNLSEEMDEADVRPGHQIMSNHEPQMQAVDLTTVLDKERRPMIRNLNFSLEAGETMSIVGPAGTGKSLLLRTLIGAIRPEEGQVTIKGIDLHQLSTERLGRLVGYVPRNPELLDGSLGQNIARFGGATIDRLDQVVAQVGLQRCLALMPNGYDTPTTVAVRYLSQTHLRFIALARALYSNPALLVLDQIDSNLDQASLEILGSIVQQSQLLGQVVILATNRTSIMKQLNRVLVLSEHGIETLCDASQLQHIAQARPSIRELGGNFGSEL